MRIRFLLEKILSVKKLGRTYSAETQWEKARMQYFFFLNSETKKLVSVSSQSFFSPLMIHDVFGPFVTYEMEATTEDMATPVILKIKKFNKLFIEF